MILPIANDEIAIQVTEGKRKQISFNGRIALACSGIGHVNRGYEASVAELFNAIANKVDVQLYQGKGSSPGKRCWTTIGRRSGIYDLWPMSRIRPYSRYRNENYSFAAQFITKLMTRPVDIVFTPDHCLAMLLKRVRGMLPRKPIVVFSNGAPFENSFCEKFDAVHQKSYEHYAASVGTELQKKSWLIPNGFDAKRLVKPDKFDRSNFLDKLGVDPTTVVVLALAAHNKQHKRVDWLLTEFAKLDQAKFTLVVAGQPTDDSMELERQRDQLNCNARFVTVPQEEVPGLIWASDFMALCSLSEGFPRAVAESMGGKRHIIVHPHDNAKWIIGDNEFCFADMEQESALANAIQFAADNPDRILASAATNNERFLKNFTWERVADSYLEMFAELVEERNKTGMQPEASGKS